MNHSTLSRSGISTNFFIYLSDLLGKRVVDSQNQIVGRLCDLSLHLSGEIFPRAESLIVKRGFFTKEYARIPWVEIVEINNFFQFKNSRDTLIYQKEPIVCEFAVSRDVLDQQVVDTNHQKVVRVNDVHLLKVDHQICLAHVDVGLRGLVRRLGWTRGIDFLVKIFSPDSLYLTQETLISWKNTHVLTIGRSKNVVCLDVERTHLTNIPPAELADIMEDLDVFGKMTLFKTFNFDLQKKVFTDMTLTQKEELLDHLPNEAAGQLLDNIPADEVTDLLHHVPRRRMLRLLKLMHSKTSKKLSRLLKFAQNSAGGLMTTEYLSLGKDALVKDGMQKIKDNVDYPGNLFFIYLVDENHRLVGVTSLRRFINSNPEAPLLDLCYSKKIFVRPDDGMEEIALLLEKYKLPSIPVLNEEDILQGVITSDDVMEELISLIWRKYKNQL